MKFKHKIPNVGFYWAKQRLVAPAKRKYWGTPQIVFFTGSRVFTFIGTDSSNPMDYIWGDEIKQPK